MLLFFPYSRIDASEASVVLSTLQKVSWYLCNKVSATQPNQRDIIKLTERMAAAQLWLLCIFSGKLVSDAVKELDVALLRILLHGGDKSP
jgi:hypothetical protein